MKQPGPRGVQAVTFLISNRIQLYKYDWSNILMIGSTYWTDAFVELKCCVFESFHETIIHLYTEGYIQLVDISAKPSLIPKRRKHAINLSPTLESGIFQPGIVSY